MVHSSSDAARMPLYIGIGFFLALILAGTVAILLLNRGHFVYTLDDPYIHLRLAEQIARFHYGINANEYAAPSSSMLWPFLLAPIASVEIAPFLINVAAGILTIAVFWSVADRCIGIGDMRKKNVRVSAVLLLLILSSNVIGLAFSGMEHSLQLLVVSVVALGLVTDAGREPAAPWLLLAIAVAPLLRYENLAVSLPALLFLFSKKHYAASMAVLLVIAACVGGFSCFLMRLGLGPLPASVLAKTPIPPDAGLANFIVGNFLENMSHARGWILCAGFLGFGAALFFQRRGGDGVRLIGAAMSAIAMHVLAGKNGWYNRYELYLWTFLLLVALRLSADPLTRLLGGAPLTKRAARLAALGICAALAASSQYMLDLWSLPLASNNIHEQQYQLHRFAVEFYKAPVAVNDIGYVSYKNDSYVLDVYGLASPEALERRNKRRDAEWMNELANRHNVEIAMIYRSFFGAIPASWIKVGELRLGRRRITPAFSAVSFYAMHAAARKGIVEKLRAFANTTPDGVVFVFESTGE